jgi:hypothetical protein
VVGRLGRGTFALDAGPSADPAAVVLELAFDPKAAPDMGLAEK